jgi:uncharacterized delta-60 repeat protein
VRRGLSRIESRSSFRFTFPIATIAALTLVAVFPLSLSWAAPGGLDPTFGKGGIVVTDFGDHNDNAHAVALQPDGKILAAGLVLGDFGVARYGTDGTLDGSFGAGGKVTTDILGLSDQANALAVQPDGKILLAGQAFSLTTAYDFAIVRLNPDGSLDSSFGNNGKVLSDFSGSIDIAYAMCVQTDGKILLAGETQDTRLHIGLARYNQDGTLDSTFGNGGKVTTTSLQGTNRILALAIQNDGKIVGAGTTFNPDTAFDFAVTRYNADGTVDMTFGSGGAVTTDFFEAPDVATSVAIQPDGKIITGGWTLNEFVFKTDFALARYGTDGSLDTSFGVNGKVVNDFAHSADEANAMVLQPDGKIVLAGTSASTSTHIALARYLGNGSLDVSFGSGGKIITDVLGTQDNALGLALQPDGKLVAAGSVRSTPVDDDFVLVRYDGKNFDLCIQDDGNGNRMRINTTTGEYEFTKCGGLSLSGTGMITRRGNLLTLQQAANNRRVVVSIDASANRATASIQILSPAESFSISDRNIANDTCACK